MVIGEAAQMIVMPDASMQPVATRPRAARVPPGPMIVQSRRTRVNGVELHWTEQGAGSPLLILHGLGDSQHTWGAVAALLAQKHRVLSLDLAGCGLSARPDATYGLDWHARLVAAWLDRIDVRELDVLGHSYGGGVALWLLLHRASSIRKLALVAPGGLGLQVSPFLRLSALLGLFEVGGQRLIGPITQLLLRCYGGSLSASQRRILYRVNTRPGTARAFVRTVRDVIDWRGQRRHVLQRVHEIVELPSIALFWGERDRVIPVQQGEALCALLENCSLWRLPGAGHFLHWEAPRALAEAVLAYLAGPDLRRSRLVKKHAAKFRPAPRERRICEPVA
jgi:pimeloyl-ACP methyl ester carboxylesterase